MQLWRITAAGVLSLALLGCAQVPPEPSGEPSTEESAPTFTVDPMNPVEGETPMDATPSPEPFDAAYQPLVDFVTQDLATRLGITTADVEVLDAQAVVWPDGGLGCPTPGMAYIQVQVEGALVRLRVNQQVYEYHSGGRRQPFLCEQPVAPSETPLPPPGRGEGV
jgi:hypothetical protein